MAQSMVAYDTYRGTISLATHTLTVNSDPSSIIFILWSSDKGTHASVLTPYSAVLDDGNYILDMPKSVMIGGVQYYWQKFEDGSTTSWRGIKLTADLTYKALYTTTPPAIPIWKLVAAGLATLGFGVGVYFGLRKKGKA